MSRYIDYDKALSFSLANGEYDRENANEDFIMGCETYKEWLENQPTEELTPIVLGKWLTRDIDKSGIIYTEYYCSNCDWWHGNNLITKNFCPNCGAKMEESGGNQ